jgi:hypothetical protein
MACTGTTFYIYVILKCPIRAKVQAHLIRVLFTVMFGDKNEFVQALTKQQLHLLNCVLYLIPNNLLSNDYVHMQLCC